MQGADFTEADFTDADFGGTGLAPRPFPSGGSFDGLIQKTDFGAFNSLLGKSADPAGTAWGAPRAAAGAPNQATPQAPGGGSTQPLEAPGITPQAAQVKPAGTPAQPSTPQQQNPAAVLPDGAGSAGASPRPAAGGRPQGSASPRPTEAAPTFGIKGQAPQAPSLRSRAVEAANQAVRAQGHDLYAPSASLDDYMTLEEAFLPSGEGESGGNKKPPADKPMLEKSLDVTERTYRGYVKVARQRGWNLAADFLEHYLDGKGGKVTLSREQALGFKPIADADKRIKGYFERAFLKIDFSDNEKFVAALKSLKDGGEAVQLEDHWEGKIDDLSLLARGEPDLAFALGETSVTGRGKFSARQEGDVIHIEGEVTSVWEDTYDFEKWQPFADGALALQKHRGARDFEFGVAWKRHFIAQIRVNGDERTVLKIKWADTE